MSAMPNNPLGRLINETQAARGYSDGDVEKWANRDGVRRITTKDLSAWRRAGMATLVPDIRPGHSRDVRKKFRGRATL